MEYVIAQNAHGRYAVPVESSYTFTAGTTLRGEVHEPNTIEYIIKNCGEGDIVHAGAGFGDFLPALCRACQGQVFTFEPNRNNYLACLETIRLNNLNNIQLFDCGLDSSPTTKHLQVEEDGLALGVRSEIKNQQVGTQEIKVDTLDNIIMPRSRCVSIIHLDVEGYEFQVLDGAQQLISRDHPLIILEIDGRALTYNKYMEKLNYKPAAQLIYDAKFMVFVNTVYKFSD